MKYILVTAGSESYCNQSPSITLRSILLYCFFLDKDSRVWQCISKKKFKIRFSIRQNNVNNGIWTILSMKTLLLLLSKRVLIICVTVMFFFHTTVYFQYKYHKGNMKLCVLFLCLVFVDNLCTGFSCPWLVGILCWVALSLLHLWTREN